MHVLNKSLNNEIQCHVLLTAHTVSAYRKRKTKKEQKIEYFGRCIVNKRNWKSFFLITFCLFYIR